MPRTCIRFFALLLLLLVAVPALQAAPLLQEGKKTLYQRVVSHPGAMPLKEARDGAPAAREALVPFTVLYVYARQGDWLQVGLDTRAPLGWLKKDQATDWNQSLTLLFTPRTGRDPVLFFKTEKDLKGLCEAADMEKQLDSLYGAEALDISTDITVLENMMAREGLVDSPLKAEPDEKKETDIRLEL